MVKKKDKFKKIAVPKRNRRKPPKLPLPAAASSDANQLPQDAGEFNNDDNNNNNNTPHALVPGMLVSDENQSGMTNSIPPGAVVLRKRKKKKKKKKKDKSNQKPEDYANQEWVPSEEEEEVLQNNRAQEDEDNLDDEEEYQPSELEQELLNLADREDRPRRTYNMPELSEEAELERSLRRRTNARGTPKSDYLGVSWCNRKQQWHGRIWLKQKKRLVWIGYYDDQVECAKAVNKACVEHNIPIKNPNLPL